MFESARAYSGFASDDLGKMREFYGETLGFEISEPFPGGLIIQMPGGGETLVYEKPDFTPATYTILNFEVENAEAAVDELNSKGIEMERYEGFPHDDKGIVRDEQLPTGAWFTDPSGNILLVHERM